MHTPSKEVLDHAIKLMAERIQLEEEYITTAAFARVLRRVGKPEEITELHLTKLFDLYLENKYAGYRTKPLEDENNSRVKALPIVSEATSDPYIVYEN